MQNGIVLQIYITPIIDFYNYYLDILPNDINNQT